MAVTVGEVSRTFEKLPTQLPVTVCVDGELTVIDRTGDRVSGYYGGMFDVGGIADGEVFVSGQGYCPVIVLKTSEEL